MKHLFYFALTSCLVLVSCSKNEDTLKSEHFALNDFPQTWKLVKMTGSLEGSESIGEEMAWQENYHFKADGTFLKTRNTAGESESATGRYIYESENQQFLLDYDRFNEIIGSCSTDAKEHLYFNKEKEGLMSTWRECDGPGLVYERIK